MTWNNCTVRMTPLYVRVCCQLNWKEDTAWLIGEAVWHKGVQFSSVAQSCPSLCDPMNCRTPGLPVYHQLLEFIQTHIDWVDDASNYFIFCCPLLLLSSIFSAIRVFSNGSTLCMRWPKYWSFSFSITREMKYLLVFTYHPILQCNKKRIKYPSLENDAKMPF